MTLFPYTTLFRSATGDDHPARDADVGSQRFLEGRRVEIRVAGHRRRGVLPARRRADPAGAGESGPDRRRRTLRCRATKGRPARGRLARGVDEKFDRYTPRGTPQEVAEALLPYVHAGCTDLDLHPVAGGLDEEVAAIGEVRRLLRAELGADRVL